MNLIPKITKLYIPNNIKQMLTKAIYLPNDDMMKKQKNKFISIYKPDPNTTKKICKAIFYKLINKSWF